MQRMKIGTTQLTGFLLTMLGCGRKWNLPRPDFPGTVDAGGLLQIRQELENTGLVELDFDGKLHPTREFARMAYNITHAKAAMGWKADGELIYLRGPVDDLLLCCEHDLWTMELAQPSQVILWVKELIKEKTVGTVWAMGEPDEIPKEVSIARETDSTEVLIALLDIYFGGGKPNA